jgi:hypothetical protein
VGVQDTTDRFAYLFEPIDAEPTARGQENMNPLMNRVIRRR